jgi:hypothetical protein
VNDQEASNYECLEVKDNSLTSRAGLYLLQGAASVFTNRSWLEADVLMDIALKESVDDRDLGG